VALRDGTRVGIVTSGSFAPSLGHAIALAWVDEAHADAENFIVRAANTELPAQQTALPFHKEGTARKKHL
jgi:aminomethyltransferase